MGQPGEKAGVHLAQVVLTKYETDLIAAVKKFPQFTAPRPTPT